MVATALNLSDSLKRAEDALRADTRTKGMLIKRMGEVNTVASQAKDGWVGLYVDEADYEPRRIGTQSRDWEVGVRFRIVVQAVDMNSSARAHERLEKYVKDVLDVVLGDRTLGGLLEALNSINVAYAFDEDQSESLHFEAALLTLVFTGRAS